jgi:hypothetical protein
MQQGDSLCDQAIEELTQQSSLTGIDLYAALESHINQHGREPSCSAFQFWESVHQLPPDSIRVDERGLQLGRELFLDNAIQISQALLYYSLAGGFAR